MITPVSSCVSRIAHSSSDSPYSRCPPGLDQVPSPCEFLRITRKDGEPLEHPERRPSAVLCSTGSCRPDRGLLCPVLPHRFVLVNTKPGAQFLETRDELAAPPGMVLFMQQM